MQRLRDEELMDRLDHGGRDELIDDPVVVVECGSLRAVDGSALEMWLSALPAVLIGTGVERDDSLAQAMDVIADGTAEIEQYERAITEHPEAAVSLAVLLRGGGHRSVSEGLVVESATYSMLQAGPDHRRWLRDRGDEQPRATESGAVVQVQRDGDHLCITLDRPDTRNAFSAEMRDALLDALAVVAADESLTATIHANGPSFCSGGDLREFGTVTDPATGHLLRLRRSVGRAIDEVAARVTVEVHGHCVGAGVELPSFAGRVVATPDATFRLPEIGMGLIPGAGGTVSIPRRIGRRRTMRLALLDEPIDAAVALEWGLVDALTHPR